MGSTADLRNGAIIKFNGENCVVLESQHVKPGKGGAYFQVKMRNIKTGRTAENRFRSGESIDFVRVDKLKYQYLYTEGNLLVLMDMDTYEQISVDKVIVGNSVKFLKENEEVFVSFEGDEVLDIELPLNVTLRIIHTEPGFRGDTATNVMKPATVETGAEIAVPLFINEGDLVRVDTKTGSYSERVKE
jgi:elongation factor P